MMQSRTRYPSVTPPLPLIVIRRSRGGTIIVGFILLLLLQQQQDNSMDHVNVWQSPQQNERKMRIKIYRCQHFEMTIVMQCTCLGVTVSLFDIYLAFRNVNEMLCKYINSGGYVKCKCNANAMQMKCNANTCEKDA